jgi:hypothetical protein
MKMIFTHKSLLKSPSIQRTKRERDTHTHGGREGEREGKGGWGGSFQILSQMVLHHEGYKNNQQQMQQPRNLRRRALHK